MPKASSAAGGTGKRAKKGAIASADKLKMTMRRSKRPIPIPTVLLYKQLKTETNVLKNCGNWKKIGKRKKRWINLWQSRRQKTQKN